MARISFLEVTRVLRFVSASAEISKGVKKATDILQQIALEGLCAELDRMLPLVLRVMRQEPGRASSTATLMWKTRFSACSSRRPEIIRKDKPASPMSSAK
ncbi:hypothetical protein IVB56_13615 [Bradyrhizobium sp. CW7]|uniref:hypothetical protein n=1 Tax=Bradyrhizobium sp. CW7 TaxID=2782688 RepID=UPI001FF7AAF8|nr:hypothetical protein [Bradyrhizobium sp. CW7]MCK1352100.1 hypothetical protein [Bradyrhizobium sp. CW7]